MPRCPVCTGRWGVRLASANVRTLLRLCLQNRAHPTDLSKQGSINCNCNHGKHDVVRFHLREDSEWVKLRRMGSFVRNNAMVIVAAVVAVVLLAVAVAYPDNSGAASSQEGEERPVAVKASLGDYDWSELSRISSEISQCTSKEEAISRAHRYALCNADGSFGDANEKEVVLKSGLHSTVRLADVWHDNRSDGGKAGLTFVFGQPVGAHAMNHAFENASGNNADSVGGWASCDMRSWLNGDFQLELPDELSARIVSVQKRSASSPDTRDELDEAGRLSGTGADWTVETSDGLWLLSASELCGPIPVKRDFDIDSTITSVYAVEGEQYRLFSDAGVKAFKPNAATSVSADSELSDASPCTWWLRTKTLEFGDGFWLVGTDGTPLNGLGEDSRVVKDPTYAPDNLWGPDHARAVVPAFCL